MHILQLWTAADDTKSADVKTTRHWYALCNITPHGMHDAPDAPLAAGFQGNPGPRTSHVQLQQSTPSLAGHQRTSPNRPLGIIASPITLSIADLAQHVQLRP